MFFHIEDSYVIDEGSGDEEVESSDDDEGFDLMLNAIIGQKQGKRKTIADDFEREMNEELDSTIEKMQVGQKSEKPNVPAIAASTSETPAEPKTETKDVEKKFYEDVYFDSDSDDDCSPTVTNISKRKKKHPIISDDDLFYDPTSDQKDQDWVDRRRRSHQPKSDQPNLKPRSRNDEIVLNCPACMTTLCDDCQRHDVYQNQFRAMFVLNCTVDTEKILEHKEINKQKKKFAKDQESSLQLSTAAEFYHPVRCSICKTEVAVYDNEEVYHFFNVLAG